MYFVSSPGDFLRCGLKHTNIKLQTLQAKDLILLFEVRIRDGNSSVVGNRYIKPDEKTDFVFTCKKVICLGIESQFTYWWI